MYIVLVCFGIVTISVLCTVIEIKTEVELICLAVCLGLSLEDLVLEQPIFKSAHNKKTTEGFFSSCRLILEAKRFYTYLGIGRTGGGGGVLARDWYTTC